MHVLEFVNYLVVPTEECMLIKPLRDLYNKDKSKTKEKFMQLLSVVYFLADPRSSYSYIIDEGERLLAIIQLEALPTDFKIDNELLAAIDVYKKHTITTSALLLESTRIAIEKVRTFLRDVDLMETDDKGKPKYTINVITSALKQIPLMAKDLEATEKALTKEIEEMGRARGGNETKKAFEDGI